MPQPAANSGIPFDAVRLDQLMEAASIDVLIATSKHNVQYLLGGYRFSFFDTMDLLTVGSSHNRAPSEVEFRRGDVMSTDSGGNHHGYLETGMIFSIETTMPHPRRGYIEIEDTIVVTQTGYEALGDDARGRNRAGNQFPSM